MEFDAKTYVDHLVDIAKSIEPGKLTMITGSNASGKSVIRKCIQPHIARKLELAENANIISELSFMTRAENTLSGINFLRDSSWTSTGENTARLLLDILKVNERYIVLDEPELGMGEELQLSIANYINENKDSILEHSYGIMIITHSRVIVNTINDDIFINIDNPQWTKSDWLNRKVEPIDVEALEDKSIKIFREIRDRSNKK